jgi:CheY-like chemotaxis protein
MPQPREPKGDAPSGPKRDETSRAAAELDESTRSRRLEFARMLLGAARRPGAGDPPPAHSPSTRVAPVASASMQRPLAASARGGAAPKPVGESSGAKVLVIDDDPVIRDMVVRVLARENLVYEAGDGASGLAVLQRIGAVDVIVCDVMMPNLDGFGFAEAVKADPGLNSIPILFLTARDSAKDRLEGIRVGARSYLTKPFKVKDLMSAVARAARKSSANR